MTRAPGEPPEPNPVSTQVLEAVEVMLGLVNTRPLGSRPDGFHRSSPLGPALLELIGHTSAPTFLSDLGTAEHVTEVRRLREAITAVLLADTATSAHQALDRLADTYRCGWEGDGTPSPATVLSVALLPLLRLAVGQGVLQRIGVCPAPCHTVFLERSRHRRRRYCSPRCGTRARMAKHRQQARA
jgi:hypothetical protein